MTEPIQDKSQLLASLPPEWPEDLLPAIRQAVQAIQRKLVVLDDDPTGTQTVYGLPVLTEWPTDRLAEELRGDAPAFYLLTNSRSLPLNQARALNAEIGANLLAASQQTGQEIAVISRSDSTLRGHFPGEIQALAEALQTDFDAWIIAPFFPEGGRFTVVDVHYVAEGERLIPAGQTEFANDKSFGYHASNLREWVAEKTGGAVPAGEVISFSIKDLREGGPDRVTEKLLALPKTSICVVNAASYRDLEVFVLALLRAEAAGKRYLYRTAASIVRVRAGLPPRPLLTRVELDLPESGGGFLIAGSYVPRTSAQLETLFTQTQIERVEMDVAKLLDENQRTVEIQRVVETANRLLAENKDTTVYTSRQLISVDGGAERNLAIGRVVSDSLVAVVHGLTIQPRYILAKGGITSSDIATLGLGIRRAEVLGQILPGVPVWRSGPESRYPGLPYIVFPGNVGGPDALAQIVNDLAG